MREVRVPITFIAPPDNQRYLTRGGYIFKNNPVNLKLCTSIDLDSYYAGGFTVYRIDFLGVDKSWQFFDEDIRDNTYRRLPIETIVI